MSIRPVDRTTMISNTQKMSNDRQGEISKGEHIAHNISKDFQKEVEIKQERVMDTEETIYNKIRDDDPRDNRGNHFKGNKERKQEDSDDKKPRIARGSRLDIRI